MQVTEYANNGQIIAVYGYPDQETFNLNKSDEMNYMEGSFDATSHYILNGQPTERPVSPVTIDGRTLSNVPAGSTLWIDGEQYEAEGEVELEFPLPGTYRLRVECWPYKDWEGEVVVPVLRGAEA